METYGQTLRTSSARLDPPIAKSSQTPAEITPVLDARHGLTASLEELHAGISTLERRLTSVLLPVGPSTGSDAGTGAVQSASPLRDYLVEQQAFVRQASSRIADLLNRLEV